MTDRRDNDRAGRKGRATQTSHRTQRNRAADRNGRDGASRSAPSGGEWVAGRHAAMAALAARGDDVLEVFVQRGAPEQRLEEVMDTAGALGVRAQRVPGATLDAMAGGVRHQGVVLRLRARPAPDFTALLDVLRSTPHDVLVLDGVDDPHNLGACLRSAAAAGAAGVVVPRSRSAPVTAAARKVSSGGAERVPVYAVANLARALRALRDIGMPVLGLDGHAGTSIYGLDLRAPQVLVVGTESAGIRTLTRSLCDAVAAIPMRGEMESLNMSVAVGVALFEMYRQREAP